MFSFPLTQQYLYFVACMSLIYFKIWALSHFSHSFVRKYVFLQIIWSCHLFQIYSGQVNSILYNIRIFDVIKFPIFRGYAFLAVTAHSIFTFKIYREMQSYPDTKGLFVCKMSSFVCSFICSNDCCSLSPCLLVVDNHPPHDSLCLQPPILTSTQTLSQLCNAKYIPHQLQDQHQYLYSCIQLWAWQLQIVQSTYCCTPCQVSLHCLDTISLQ